MIKVKKYFSLLIIIFVILSNIAFAESISSNSGFNENKVSNEEVQSKEEDVMNRFMKGEAGEDEMRAVAKAKMGAGFSEEEFQKGMMELKQRASRKETFSYEHEGYEGSYYVSPSYEGYSKEHMIFGRVFEYIGDEIDPREIKQYCNDPNKIADLVISKFKEKVGDLQKICSQMEEQEAKCNQMSKKTCSQIGTPHVREGASDLEKIQSVAYSCPVNRGAIIEACKIRDKSNIEQRMQDVAESCEQRFDFQGERLMQECERFKEHQICDKEKFMSQCLGGIKKEDFERKGTTCDISECGPQLGMPNYLCADGKTSSGPTGRCLRHEDGTCRWEVISCPAQSATCPTQTMPTCKEGETLQKKSDDKGCVYYYCQSTTTTTNTATATCTESQVPTCPSDQTLQKKVDDRGCVSYYCQTTTTTTSITGSAVLSTYDDYLRHCESSWMQQQKICSNTPSVCDKEIFIQKCAEQERKNSDDFMSRIEKNCETQTISKIKYAEQRCSKIDEERQRCLVQSAKRCEQMKGLAQECKDTLTEEKLRNFIVGEVTKRCKFGDIIENEDDVKKSEKAEIVLAVLNTATQSDFDKLKLFVDNLEEDLKLQDTTVYKGTIEPSKFGDIKLLPFVVNAKLSSVESSERAKEVKAKIVAGQKAEDTASKLISLRDSDVPKEYLYIIEDKASDVLNVSDNLKDVEKKEGQKGLGYRIRLFLGLAKAAEQQEIKQLQDSKEKLKNSIDVLTKLSDEVPSDVAKSILKEQVENLKKQQEDIGVLIATKEKKSKGLLGIFG